MLTHRVNPVKTSSPLRLIIFYLLLVSWLLVTSQPAPAIEPPVAVQSIASVGFTVSDMDRSIAFYRDVLTFQPVSDVEADGPAYDRLYGCFGVRVRIVRMQLGEQQIELTQFISPPDLRPVPAPSYSNDLWFQHFAIVVRDMDAAWARLRKHHVRQISPRPQTIPVSNQAAGGIRAIKFRDPDGHNLELLWFPAGKGHPIWENRVGPDVFLGIDHTAITVRSTEKSLRFYRDLLGFTVAGGTLNMGIEQEQLDGLPGARVRVTGLTSKRGPPGVEFLEYELPTAGRPFPIDSHPTDLWHWQTTVVVPDVETAAGQVRGMGEVISAGVITLPDTSVGFTKGIIVRDPDGHAIRLVSVSP